jgi:hypothetical protein
MILIILQLGCVSSDVSPKEGYDEVSWDPSAALIWGTDLESHNTILCRFLVE